MGNNASAIMDAAELRIRSGGMGGFSFREIASDVGVKSSSVHYHFRTKEKLAAAVIRRYTDSVAAQVDQEISRDSDVAAAWIKVFRPTAFSEKRMCPATILGAASLSLPAEVATEVEGFFRMCLSKLAESGLFESEARRLLSTLIGAIVCATALGDPGIFDGAVENLEIAPHSCKKGGSGDAPV